MRKILLTLAVCFFTIAPQLLSAMDFSVFSTRGFEGKGALEFNSPEDVVITKDGQFVVADQKNNRLQVLDSNGGFIRMIPPKNAPAVKLQPNENESKIETRIRERKERSLTKLQNTFHEPIGLAFDKNGLLYVSLMQEAVILVIDFKTGYVIDSIGRNGPDRGEFYYPMDIDISSDNLLAVAEFRNKRVQILDLSTGKCVKELLYQEAAGNGKSLNSLKPRGVHWTNAGRLIVTYPEYNQVVCWEPQEGKIIWRYGAEEGSQKGLLNNPSFVCSGTDGNLLISDTLNHRIVEITRSGKFCEHYSKKGNAPGKLYCPRGLVLNPAENLFVCDQGNNRIQFFQPGQATLILREAKQYALKDDWENAKNRIAKVLYLQPNNEQARDLMVNALYYFGDSAFAKGDYKNAENNYRKVLRYRPEDANIAEKLDAVFWADNQEIITVTILVVIAVIGGLFCLWTAKVVITRFLKSKK